MRRSEDIETIQSFLFNRNFGLQTERIKRFNKQSGMLSLTGLTVYAFSEEAENGNADCKLALESRRYRVKKH
jgi:acetate kinase